MSDVKKNQTVIVDSGDALELQISVRIRDSITAIENRDKEGLLSLISTLHVADIAELITLLRTEHRKTFIELVGKGLDSAVLPELDEHLQSEISALLETDMLVAAMQELEIDDAVSVLGDMKEETKKEVLEQIPDINREVLQRNLEYAEDSAGRLMHSNVVCVPPFWSIGQTIDYLREAEGLPDEFSEVFIIDPMQKPIGVVQLNRFVRSPRETVLTEVMGEHLTLISVQMDREDMARQFDRYNLISAPVVDESQRLVGVITADDVFEVMAEEAEEDLHRLGGVGNESVTETSFSIVKRRFPWLFVNLLTAIMASIVIAAFDATIEQMVALAVLMPIVASMGGNAGTQSLTIAVRALATQELMTINAMRVILREAKVAIINGVCFSILLGVVGALWFHNMQLGIVLILAMIVNMFVAGLAGILIPFTLDRFGIDPAIASAVCVTTVTDIVGFLAFLSFAQLLLF